MPLTFGAQLIASSNFRNQVADITNIRVRASDFEQRLEDIYGMVDNLEESTKK